MTRAEQVYAETLNLLGSDVPDEVIQDIVDWEHALADPIFSRTLAERWAAATGIAS